MTDRQVENSVASLIIIGDEILRGQVQDANTIYLAKSLQTLGIKIQRVVIIPDEVDLIAKEVAEASQNYPIVFTSGGVGPTHDDLTYEGVAKAFGLNLEENETRLMNVIKLFPNKPEARRLAIVPTPCELVQVSSPDSSEPYSVVKVNNVYVLPGSPRFFHPAVNAITAMLEPGQTLHNDSLDVELDEFALVEALDDRAKSWAGVVAIGSYPQSRAGQLQPRTRITLESKSREAVAKAKAELLAMLPCGRIKRAKFDEEYAIRVYESTKEMSHVKRSFDVLEECYRKYKTNEIFLSFNGGKDCTVVLHLTAALVQLKKFQPPLCLYVTGDAFPEVEEFVKEAANYYNFELVKKTGPIKEALSSLLDERPDLKACLLGTRKGDPGADSLQPFTPTDLNWPKIMRVSPIIDWSYSQVWQFLLKHEVSYCSLYDKGYTSLGARNSTIKNPLLQDPKNPLKYLPAHSLTDDSTERQGRR